MLPCCFADADFAPTLAAALARAKRLVPGAELGDGSIARVVEGRCPDTSQAFAVKRVRLPSQGEAAARVAVLRRVAREAAAAQVLAAAPNTRHAGIVRHYACVYDSDADEVLLVMQRCRGPCLARARLCQPGGRMPEGRVGQLGAAVARSLGVLHGVGLLAVDLKPENVVLHDDGGQDAASERPVLVDLDLCRDLPLPGGSTGGACEAAAAAVTMQAAGGAAVEAEPAGRIWGTAEYLAYEVLQEGASAYSVASDWWALGVMLYELLYGRPPWSAPSLEGLLARMACISPPFPGPAEGGPQVSADMVALLRGLLRARPETRLGTKGGAAEVVAAAALQQGA